MERFALLLVAATVVTVIGIGCRRAASPAVPRTSVANESATVADTLSGGRAPYAKRMGDSARIVIRGSTGPHENWILVLVDDTVRQTPRGRATAADSAVFQALRRECIAQQILLDSAAAVARFGPDGFRGALIIRTVPSWNGQGCSRV